MNIPTVSLMLTRRYVTELVRSPRAAAALSPGRTAAAPAARSGPAIPTVAAGVAPPPAPR
jgi:hypothetical protein